MLAEQKAEVEKKLQEWRKKNPQAVNDPPPEDLLPPATVRATHSQLTKRLGIAAKDLIGPRLRSAIDAGAIVRANPGATRSAGGEYQIVTTSAALSAGKSASTALPHPAAVAAMQADPTRLAQILSRIDDGMNATPRRSLSSNLASAAQALAKTLMWSFSPTSPCASSKEGQRIRAWRRTIVVLAIVGCRRPQ
jgi:hypothetical protein